MSTYYIGADGGGTRTTAVLMSESGEIRKVVRGKGLNYHAIGMEKAQMHLKELVDELTAGLEDASEVRIGVGMSALDDLPTEKQLSDFSGSIFEKENLFLHSDAYMALMAATLGESGALVICGTGSMAVYADETLRQTPAGGWGYLLGDYGSSYQLAIDGIKAAIRAFEKTGENTRLTDAMMKRFSLSAPRQLIDYVYSPSTVPSDIAKFAIDVLNAAYEGDSVAMALVKEHFDILSKIVDSLTKHNLPDTVWLFGGVFEHNAWVITLFGEMLSRFKKNVRASLIPYPPAIGSAVYAMKKCGQLTENVLETMKNTYEETDF
ncbi:MAG: hypothetical protein IIX93_10415 [Clostridia bacterium]|nr:hypothetical protein [Clostridia bacterium]